MEPAGNEDLVAAWLIAPDDGAHRAELLGLSLGLRLALTAAQVQAPCVVVGADDDLELLRDARLGIPVRHGAPPSGVVLVLRADAVIAPRSLAELGVGEVLCDDDGSWLAARLCIEGGADVSVLESLIATAERHPAERDRYHFAIRVGSAEARSQARRALMGALIKPSDGPMSRHFNRHISRAVTRLVLPLGATPNQLTVVVAVTGLLAAYYAAMPGYWAQLGGALLYQLHSVLDGCDGEIARLTHRFGKYGALIDSVVDDACNLLFFVGLSLGVAAMLGASWPLWAAGVTAGAYVPTTVLQYSAVLRSTGSGDKTSFWSADSGRLTLFDLLRALLRRDVFVVLVLLAVAVGQSPLMAAIFPLAALGTLGASVGRFLKSRAA
ncbi:MAG: CDP-alcohol phosphatidyltransferase family protein [Myxococcales bacterium]|nr:CDP-alcohol phosphatidyltransferase family protein [Myxococcales bacterium]